MRAESERRCSDVVQPVGAGRRCCDGCAIIRPPRDGGIRYRGLTQEQVCVQVLPVDYEIEYICRASRVIVGPKVRKCLPNGTWTDLSQRSRCLLLCPRMWTSLENGRVSSWPLGPPVEGTVLHYSCLPGFILMGPNSTQCNKMGMWDTPKPVCRCESLLSYAAWPRTLGDTLSCRHPNEQPAAPPSSDSRGTLSCIM
uniref:Sushi domain-containing protein n=1 Tax=Stegastes partitus TaxID=144197 RepID=A0A3B4ZJ16_9TELE